MPNIAKDIFWGREKSNQNQYEMKNISRPSINSSELPPNNTVQIDTINHSVASTLDSTDRVGTKVGKQADISHFNTWEALNQPA